VRLAALIVLIIGNLLANQVHAEDVSAQPLTRVDCDKAEMAWDENANVCIAHSGNVSRQPLTRLDCENAGMAWNDTANVCGEASQAAEERPEPQIAQPISKSGLAVTLVQPLTRHECDKAGMTWNDTTNVCDEKSQDSATQTGPKETNPAASTVLINIDKASQKMTVFLDGVQQYEWPVSTGIRGYTTPSGTYTTSSMNKIWYSKQWDNAPMPHAVFFTKEGHAIHGTYEVKRLGKPASHGCVRISKKNAAMLYALVTKTGLKNTQVVLAGLTPGGEGKVATVEKSKSSYRQSSRSFKQGNTYYADSFSQRPRQGGFLRRLFGGR
jgi:lipoprotein-anchoring transpeptidase ErfK/SrfK